MASNAIKIYEKLITEGSWLIGAAIFLLRATYVSREVIMLNSKMFYSSSTREKPFESSSSTVMPTLNLSQTFS